MYVLFEHTSLGVSRHRREGILITFWKNYGFLFIIIWHIIILLYKNRIRSYSTERNVVIVISMNMDVHLKTFFFRNVMIEIIFFHL